MTKRKQIKLLASEDLAMNDLVTRKEMADVFRTFYKYIMHVEKSIGKDLYESFSNTLTNEEVVIAHEAFNAAANEAMNEETDQANGC